MDAEPNEITKALMAAAAGDAQAASRLFSLVYDELRRLAAAKLANERAGHTLQATALVHEVWLRLGGDAQPTWKSRGHFFGAAAEAMRRILVESARRRSAARHGGRSSVVSLDEIELPFSNELDDRVLHVNEALEKFALVDPRKAELVKLRYFVGLSFEEAALALDIAVPTAKGWWAYARAWLTTEMRGSADARDLPEENSKK